MYSIILITMAAGLSALAFGGYLTWGILKKETGTARMREISDVIHEGSRVFLKEQYKIASISVMILTLILAIFLGSFVAVAFLVGAISTAFAGYMGMGIATRANVRTANAARKSLAEALNIAFHGGVIMGLSVIALGLLGVSILYFINPNPSQIVGFGFGSSVIALFARVGGGIFTKAADVGADLVGKVERGIPEDDPRNPAVIADQVGDNVGDVAGMGADLFQSYVCALIATMVIGSIAYPPPIYGAKGITFPILMGVIGIFATMFGALLVRTKKDPLMAVNKGLFATGIFATIGFYFLAQQIFGILTIFYAMLSGIMAAILIGIITQYYTSYERPPVKEIARAAKSGPAINIITGLAIGLRSSAPTIIVVCGAILAAYSFAGLYGILLAVMGMHAITGMIVAVDSYGPIVDNAGGIVEMSGLGKEVREITDKLDSVGNTTKAITKAFAISDAALAELALFTAFFAAAGIQVISITDPIIVVGLFIGGAIPFILCAFCLQAVGKAAFGIVEEVRRQFREIKGLMEGEVKPDYARCVDISTINALKEMIAPVILAVIAPIAVGFALGPEALGGLLAGSVASGLLLAIFMANTGNAWDNAKKYIEAGYLGGKGSETHKAAVVGDTVGDPFKDTAGPSLNVLIKMMNTIALLFAGLFLAHAILI